MNYSLSYNNIPEKIRLRLRDANLFYTSEFEENVRYRGQTIIYIWDDTAILVSRMKKVLFLKAAILDSEPFVFEGRDYTQQFLDEAMGLLKSKGVQWTECSTTARFKFYPKNSRVVPSGNYIIDLSLSNDQLWSNVHSKHRNSIRKGEKDGIQILFGHEEFLNEYVKLSDETYMRSNGHDAGYDYNLKLLKALHNNSIISFAKNKEGELQSAGMFYYNDSMAYYLHGASKGRPSPGATNYLLWSVIMHFKEMGVKYFSFVGYHNNAEPGSKLDGIQRFKERFGGPLEQSFNFKFIQNKCAYNIYRLVMRLKSGKIFEPYKDSIDKQIEKFKYEEYNKGI